MSTSSKPVLAETAIQPYAYADTHCVPHPAADAARLAEQEERAREQGRQEGETAARARYEQQVAQFGQTVAQAVGGFAAERANYFQRVEAEVVQLALSVARKILHRESQVDPLLLAGIVRVALGQIEAGSKVVVRVHPQHTSEWRGYFARFLDPHEVPEVVEDAALDPQSCLLETRLGTTELGIEVQLKEIEQGLFDLMAQRPGLAS
jgi:flagellar assembly protein FliH